MIRFPINRGTSPPNPEDRTESRTELLPENKNCEQQQGKPKRLGKEQLQGKKPKEKQPREEHVAPEHAFSIRRARNGQPEADNSDRNQPNGNPSQSNEPPQTELQCLRLDKTTRKTWNKIKAACQRKPGPPAMRQDYYANAEAEAADYDLSTVVVLRGIALPRSVRYTRRTNPVLREWSYEITLDCPIPEPELSIMLRQ